MKKRSLGLIVRLSVTLVVVWFTVSFFYSTALPGGSYALWRGAATGDAPTIRNLFARPQDVNNQDRDGWTPLLLAAGMGHTAAVQALLEKGANVDVQDADGKSALMRATAMGYADIVLILVEAGADVNLKDTDGNTALHHAAYGRSNPPEYSGLWVRVGPANIHLIQAPRNQYAPIAGALLAHGAKVDSINEARQTALTVAIGRKNIPVALLLKRNRARK